MSAYSNEYWVNIRVFSGAYPTTDIIHYVEWTRMPFNIRNKYDWYFRYRAALFQVKHPKSLVEIASGIHEKDERTKTLEQYKFKIQGKRAAITKVKNAIEQTEQVWDQLFPLEEYEPYQKALAKLERLEAELKELINTPPSC